jgi:glucose/arabinose dehydrogenase
MQTPARSRSKVVALRAVVAIAAVGVAFGVARCVHGPSREDLIRGGPPSSPPKEAIDRDPASASPAPGSSASRPDPCRGVPLPTEQHFVAPGLCARAVATRQGPLRELTFAPNGDLIAVTRVGTIRRYRDLDGNGVFDPGTREIVDWAETGGDNGQNCALDGDFLYCGSKEGVKRWHYGPTLEQGGAGEDVMVGQPGGGNHPFHPVHVYDGWMYVDSGSERNTLGPMPDDYITDRAVIKRFDLRTFVAGKPMQWTDGEVFVRGARNITGFTRDAKGRMYGVVNGVDDLRYAGQDVHADNPGEYVVELESGQAYGWPFCFAAERVVAGGEVVPPGTPLHADAYRNIPPQGVVPSTKDDVWCAAHMTRPMSFVGAHSAPLDIAIFDGPDGALPARWKGGAFVSMHGSWDRVPSTGHKVVWIPLDANGRAAMPTSTEAETTFPHEVVFGGGDANGPRDGVWGWEANGVGEPVVRPVGVAISPVDGALYVASDDQAVADQPGKLGNGVGDGAIYRIGVARR